MNTSKHEKIQLYFIQDIVLTDLPEMHAEANASEKRRRSHS